MKKANFKSSRKNLSEALALIKKASKIIDSEISNARADFRKLDRENKEWFIGDRSLQDRADSQVDRIEDAKYEIKDAVFTLREAVRLHYNKK